MSNSSNFHYVSDFQSYRNRLHFNTVLTLLTNGFAIFLVLKHSTKAMGFYKYYILFTIVTAFIMDIHLTVIFAPYPLFPIPAFCGVGITQSFGWFWGETIHYILMHITITFAGMSIFIGLLYQYFSLNNNATFFQTKKGAAIIFFATLCYPIPALILFFFIGYDNKEFLLEIKTYSPHLYNLVNTESCNGIPRNNFTVAYWFDCIAQILIISTLFLFISYRIHSRWSNLKNTMSANTRKIKKQYLYTLFLQMTVPFWFIIVPAVGLSIAVLTKMDNIKGMSQIGMQILALHSCFNSLTIMFVIKPYQQQLKKYSKSLIFWKKHVTATIELYEYQKRRSLFFDNHRMSVSNAGKISKMQY